MKWISGLFLLCLVIISCKDPHPALKQSDALINDSIKAIESRISSIHIPGDTLDIIVFSGHKPDELGSYDFRNDIQAAIDIQSAKGGGKVLFPHTSGPEAWVKLTETYRIGGPVELRSNIELIFQPSVRLFFECNPQAYSNQNKGVITRYEGTTIYGLSPLFRAFNIENIVFSYTGGNGASPEISGDGENWVKWAYFSSEGKNFYPEKDGPRKYNSEGIPLANRKLADVKNFNLRPSMLQFFLCRNVRVDGIKISNPPFWVVHSVFSQNLHFSNIFFDAGNVNNDGFDIESSKDVIIENIMFNNHDDNVVIKSGRDREGREGVDVKGTELEGVKSDYIQDNRLGGISENVVARKCVFKGHHAIAIGSETAAGVRNIYAVDNISVQNVKNGVYIKSSRSRGGVTENIYINNLQLNIVEDDVISLNPNYDGDTISPYIPQFKNIVIENVVAEKAHNGIRVYGWREKPTSNITIKNVHINLDPDFKENLPFDYMNVFNLKLFNVVIDEKMYDGNYSILGPSNRIKKQS
ncbi:MAG: hypothetical protein H6540_05920 [Bacteroidales bacterium]|nr:hypothetical protein [Bacteroidales bacterium]MCB9013645.1 hypothetical protein [Bacteroidales bacterium]